MLTKIGKRLDKDQRRHVAAGTAAGILGVDLAHKAGVGTAMGAMKTGPQIDPKVYADKLLQASKMKDKVHVSTVPNPIFSQAISKTYNNITPLALRQSFNLSGDESQALKDGASVIRAGNNPYVTAHELGHVTGSMAGNRAYQKLQLVSRLGSLNGMTGLLASIPTAYLGAKTPDKEETSTGTKVLKYGPGAVMLPTLFEEGRASTRAFNMIRRAEGLGKAMRGIPTLGAAGATYGLAAAAPIIAHNLSRRVARSKVEKQALRTEI